MRNRSGVALLEVLIAVTILSVAAVSLMTLLMQATSTLGRARAKDEELRAASRLLDAVSLWPREDLDRHLGARVQGAWRVRIERPLPALYVASLLDSTETHELLRTSLFRPSTSNGQR